MHTSNIDLSKSNPNAVTRLFGILHSMYGQWADAYSLSHWAETTCISTRISELRHVLNESQACPCGNSGCHPKEVERKRMEVDGKAKHYYRIVNR